MNYQSMTRRFGCALILLPAFAFGSAFAVFGELGTRSAHAISVVADESKLKAELELLREELVRMRAENAELKKNLDAKVGKAAKQAAEAMKILVESIVPLDRSELERSHAEAKESVRSTKEVAQSAARQYQDALDSRGRFYERPATPETRKNLHDDRNKANQKVKDAEIKFNKFDRELREGIMVLRGRLENGADVEVMCKGPFALQAQRLPLKSTVYIRGPITSNVGNRVEMVAEDISIERKDKDDSEASPEKK